MTATATDSHHRQNFVAFNRIEIRLNDFNHYSGKFFEYKSLRFKETFAEIPPVDLANIIEELDHDRRVMVFSTLENEYASEILERSCPMYSAGL